MGEIALIIGLLAFGVGVFSYWKSRQTIGHEAASKIIKQYAEQQKVEVHISAAQMEAIRTQWIKDPTRPAQMTFLVDGKPVGEMKVATCPYWSDTCCA